MGNSCFCISNNYVKDMKINVCLDEQITNLKTEHILNNDETQKNKPEKGLNEIKKYFIENEEEFLNQFNKREKAKKLFNKKKRESLVGCIQDNKYELMLKRLLEQKNIKRNGPKRRETIRKDDKIKSMVNEILIENKNEIKKAKDNNNDLYRKNSTLIIKNKDQSKMRFSVTIDKTETPDNPNKVKKKLYNQHLKNTNTLNEMINEGNGSSGLGKKETNKK